MPSLYFDVENCSMQLYMAGWVDRVILFVIFFSFLIGTHIFNSAYCEWSAHSTMISGSDFSMHNLSISNLLV